MKAVTFNTVNPPPLTFESKRDAYGFSVRPQHLQRYKEYANIYKEEEEERSDRWKSFLEYKAESSQLSHNIEVHEGMRDDPLEKGFGGKDLGDNESGSIVLPEIAAGKDEPSKIEKKTRKIQIWTEIRPSLSPIQDMMSLRIQKGNLPKDQQDIQNAKPAPTFEDVKSPKGGSDDSDDEFYDMERSDPVQDVCSTDILTASAVAEGAPIESSFPCKEELEVLVRGGVPMGFRGELWQAFVGVKKRRVEDYYQNLLSPHASFDNVIKGDALLFDKGPITESDSVIEKWKGQIEKDLPRTFPGHPSLDDDGRNALRRLLTAYALHNPSVGYCQAMNFFAAMLLLLMPEENAFWTLTAIIDEYFAGCYCEEMIESQVDQQVFEELVRERFPKLVNHLDYLGVQIAWITAPWFLSIFMNVLPWESVLRIWDVILFEGNRVMLFRTALALMELYGPALLTTKDAGDAVTLLQSLAGSTFDSSQLVLTACMGYQNVNEDRLQKLRIKHRPAVITTREERSNGLQAWRESQGLASKLSGIKNDPKSVLTGANKAAQADGSLSPSESESSNADNVFISLTGDGEIDSVPDLREQVIWLKDELCTLLEEKRSAVLRSEELEAALMEMVKQDNRRQLSARVEQLEQEVTDLVRALSDKQEQEAVMIKVLMRVEQEQRVTEDARRVAEQDAVAQRYAAQVLQEKYEEAIGALTEMEKRAVMAESVLEATLQYQSGTPKAQSSPRSLNPGSPVRNNQDQGHEVPLRKISLLARPFGLSWRDQNKGKPINAAEELTGEKPSAEGHIKSPKQNLTNEIKTSIATTATTM